MQIPNYDQSAQKAALPVYVPAPVGEHIMTVTSTRTTASKASRPMFVMEWEVSEGEFTGRVATSRFMLDNEWGPVQLIRTLDALGVRHDGGSFNEKACVGRKAVVKMKEGTAQNGDPRPEFHFAFRSPAASNDVDDDYVPF